MASEAAMASEAIGGNMHMDSRVIKVATILIIVSNVFPLISGGKVALNHLRSLLRFNATFPPILREQVTWEDITRCLPEDILYRNNFSETNVSYKETTF